MRSIVTIFILGFSFTLNAQQLPQYTQSIFHQFSFNPAHAGIKKCIDIHSLYRTQWVGFDGSPNSGFFTVSVPLGSKRKQYLSARQGLGFKFENDQIGPFSSNRINFAYAAHFNFSKTNRLSMGLYGGVVQIGYDPSEATTYEVDPAVMNQANFVLPDATFGAWYNTSNYYFGLSLPSMIYSKWKNIGVDPRNRFHMILNAGYQYLLKEDLTLSPTGLIRIPPRGPLSVDLSLQLNYKGFLGFGLGYRNVDALMAYFNIKLFDQLTIGYSFDYTLSDIQLAAKNTHEVSLRFTSCKTPRSSTSACPLFE